VDRRPRSEINDLHAVNRPKEGKFRVSGQKAADQNSKTYTLWKGQRRQPQSEWIEGPRSGFNDLHAVEGPEKTSSG